MNWVLALIIGFVVGFIFSLFVWYLRVPIVGVLRVDQSDPDGPYLFAELKEGASEVSKRKYATFVVNPKSYISR